MPFETQSTEFCTGERSGDDGKASGPVLGNVGAANGKAKNLLAGFFDMGCDAVEENSWRARNDQVLYASEGIFMDWCCGVEDSQVDSAGFVLTEGWKHCRAAIVMWE